MHLEGRHMNEVVRYVDVEDAIEELCSIIRELDYDDLARQYSSLASGREFGPIIVRGPCDEESGVWHDGRQMRVVLEPVAE
jgi:hypothetical protein